MKRGLLVFSSSEVAFFRIFIAAIALFPLSFRYLKLIKNFKTLFMLTLTGLLGNMFPALLFATSQNVIDSSLAGMLNSTTPLFTMLIGLSFFKVHFKWWQVLGVFIGLIGAIGLISSNSVVQFDSKNYLFALLPILASFFYGINVNIIKEYFQDMPPVAIASLSFLTLLPFSVIYLLQSDFMEHSKLENALMPLIYIVILGVVGTAFALIMFNLLIKQTTALFASVVTYFIPFVALLWGMLDGEEFKISFLYWVGMILIGVYLVNKKRKKRKGIIETASL